MHDPYARPAIRRLWRSRSNRIIGGVCGGIADYFGINASIFRFIWALTGLLGGTGILAYILAVAIVPAEPAPKEERIVDSDWAHPAAGAVLILLGVILWARQFVQLPIWFFHPFWAGFWPSVLILIGALILVVRPHRTRPVGSATAPAQAQYVAPRPQTQTTVHSQTAPRVSHPQPMVTPHPEPVQAGNLRRSRHERVIFGVCGGLGHKWGIDPAIVRLLWAIGTLLTEGAGLLVYLVLAVAIPLEPEPPPRPPARASAG